MDWMHVTNNIWNNKWNELISHMKEKRTENLSHTWFIKKMDSLADECRRHCLEGKEFGSRGGIKYPKKRVKCNNQEKTLSWDRCWWQNSPPQFYLPTYFIKPYKTNVIHSGLFGNYHIHCDPLLGFFCQYVRRIPCFCESCIETKKSEWLEGKEPE